MPVETNQAHPPVGGAPAPGDHRAPESATRPRDTKPRVAVARKPTWSGREFGIEAVMAILVVALMASPGLDWSVPTMSQDWLLFGVVVLVAGLAMFGGAVVRTSEESTQTFGEFVLIAALLWLPTPWLVLVLPAGSVVSWLRPSARPARPIEAILSQMLLVAVMLRVDALVVSGGHPTGVRTVVLGVCLWVVSELIRAASLVAGSGWAHYGTKRAAMSRLIAGMPERLALLSLALLAASLWAVSPWTFVPLFVFAVMLVRVGRIGGRVETLERGVDEVAQFSNSVERVGSVRGVEERLIAATGRIAHTSTCALAKPGAGGEVDWLGQREPAVARTFTSMDEIERLASFGEFDLGDDHSVRFFPIEELRSCYLLVALDPSVRDKADTWRLIQHIVHHAELLIESERSAERLGSLAAREYTRARTDELTGLPNRLAIMEWLDEQFSAGVHDFAVIDVGIANYPELVNVLGVQVGETVIAGLAGDLQRLGGVSMIARVGEDRFALAIPGGEKDARAIAELAQLGTLQVDNADADADEATNMSMQRDRVIGIAVTSPERPISGPDLVSRAGLACFRSLHTGRVEVYGDVEADRAERHAEVQVRLRPAIAAHRIVPFLHPQVEMDTGRIGGMEILARWNDPELGFVSPGDFIEIAEESGQAEALTVSIFEQALDALERMHANGIAVPTSVNVSARSLARPRFISELLGAVQRHNLPNSMITVEITESTVADGDQIIESIRQIAETGVQISIDDFGTGYSALSYLDRLPVDEVKIDQSMVRVIQPGRPPSPLLRRLLQLCAELGFLVVCEGVETELQCAWLRALGCDLAQGFLFARPMPPSETERWIAANTPLDVPEPISLDAAVEIETR